MTDLSEKAKRVYAALDNRKKLDPDRIRCVALVEVSKTELDEESNPHDAAIYEELIALLDYFTESERQRGIK